MTECLSEDNFLQGGYKGSLKILTKGDQNFNIRAYLGPIQDTFKYASWFVCFTDDYCYSVYTALLPQSKVRYKEESFKFLDTRIVDFIFRYYRSLFLLYDLVCWYRLYAFSFCLTKMTNSTTTKID